MRKLVRLKKPRKIDVKDNHSRAASDSKIGNQTHKLEEYGTTKIVLFRMDESHPTEGND